MAVTPTPPENYSRTCLKWDGGWLEFDAVLRQSIEHDGEVTEHPIDSDGDIVDHYRRFNIPLVLEAEITNSPIREPRTHTGGSVATQNRRTVEIPSPIALGPLAVPDSLFGFDTRARHAVTISTLDFAPGLDRINAVYEELEAIQAEPRILTVSLGGFRDFDNMLLKTFEVDRERRGVLPLVLTFRQVSFVELATVTIDVRRPKKPRSNKNENAGKKPAGEQTEPSVSLLKRITSVGF